MYQFSNNITHHSPQPFQASYRSHSSSRHHLNRLQIAEHEIPLVPRFKNSNSTNRPLLFSNINDATSAMRTNVDHEGYRCYHSTDGDNFETTLTPRKKIPRLMVAENYSSIATPRSGYASSNHQNHPLPQMKSNIHGNCTNDSKTVFFRHGNNDYDRCYSPPPSSSSAEQQTSSVPAQEPFNVSPNNNNNTSNNNDGYAILPTSPIRRKKKKTEYNLDDSSKERNSWKDDDPQEKSSHVVAITNQCNNSNHDKIHDDAQLLVEVCLAMADNEEEPQLSSSSLDNEEEKDKAESDSIHQQSNQPSLLLQSRSSRMKLLPLHNEISNKNLFPPPPEQEEEEQMNTYNTTANTPSRTITKSCIVTPSPHNYQQQQQQYHEQYYHSSPKTHHDLFRSATPPREEEDYHSRHNQYHYHPYVNNNSATTNKNYPYSSCTHYRNQETTNHNTCDCYYHEDTDNNAHKYYEQARHNPPFIDYNSISAAVISTAISPTSSSETTISTSLNEQRQMLYEDSSILPKHTTIATPEQAIDSTNSFYNSPCRTPVRQNNRKEDNYYHHHPSCSQPYEYKPCHQMKVVSPVMKSEDTYNSSHYFNNDTTTYYHKDCYTNNDAISYDCHCYCAFSSTNHNHDTTTLPETAMYYDDTDTTASATNHHQHYHPYYSSPTYDHPNNSQKEQTQQQEYTVLHKKFSWKHYPELEQFLIKNHQEYYHYSESLNYTIEQKTFNNKLTSKLLTEAKRIGYIFSNQDFKTLRSIRDRIRCFYKGYSVFLKRNHLVKKRKTFEKDHILTRNSGTQKKEENNRNGKTDEDTKDGS